MEEYKFNFSPETFQPSGCADFSKIHNPEKATVTYTNLETGKTENHNVKMELVNENGIDKAIYNLQPLSQT